MSVLSETLVKEFAKVTNDNKAPKSESFLYGTVHIADNHMDVLLDGANTTTPCTSTVSVENGDRVVVMLKDRQAVITSNITTPTIGAEYLVGRIVKARDKYLIDILRDGKTLEANFAGMEYDEEETDPERKLILYLGDESMLEIVIFPDVSLREHLYVDGTAFIKGGIEIGDMTKGYNDIHIYPASSLGGGRVYAPNFYGKFNSTSDARLKHSIEDTDETNALEKINKIRHRKFIWNDTNKEETLGYIAQELEAIDPLSAEQSPEGQYSINLSHLLALATKSIQELSSKVDELERKVIQLESERDQKLSDEE